MAAEIIICDRCGSAVAGVRTELKVGTEMKTFLTSGFYDVTLEPWNDYAEPGERNLCEPCVWADPTYLADYGYSPQDAEEQKAVEARKERRERHEKESEQDLLPILAKLTSGD